MDHKCVTLSPSLAAKCSDTQRRAFRAALPLPMLGFGSSTASSTASGCRRRFFCRISSSGVSMYVFEEGGGEVYVCVCVGRGGRYSLNDCLTRSYNFLQNDICFSTFCRSLCQKLISRNLTQIIKSVGFHNPQTYDQ